MTSSKKIMTSACAIISGLLISSPAMAQMTAGTWSVSISGGGSLAVGGTMHGGANAPVADLGALNPALAGIPATLQIQERSQNDVYDTGYELGGEIGYAVSDSGVALLAVRYLRASGNRINVGAAAAGAPVNASLPVFGDFGDYKSLSVELGYRQYLGNGSGLTPFVSAQAGATRISAISANFTVPDANIALNNVPFSGSGWVFSGGAAVGLSLPLGDTVRLEPEVGLRYASGAGGIDTALGGLGLGSINDQGARWSVPVSLRLKIAL